MPDINSIVERMTLEEKAALCTGEGPWTTTPVEHLGVPRMTVTDGPHGVRRVSELGSMHLKSLPATCFPTASLMASTWDPDLAGEVGKAIAEEAIALGVDVVLGPGANMKRTPLCGRNFEYYSEDPYLAGEMAAGFIEGVQSKGVGTSLKHYAVNNQEFERFRINAVVDERALREIYLPAFEKAVKQAKPWTVMCSYNKVNGTYASENHRLLTEILKDEWGFEGLVVSDWGAVHDRVAGLKAGLDLEMPGPKERRVRDVIEAVRSGELDESVLDEAVRRILGIVFKAAETRKGGDFDMEGHHNLARKAAAEGMVLLKNDGILPLRDVGRIAVIGRSAREPYYQGGGSSHINPTRVDIPIEELAVQLPATETIYAAGYPDIEGFQQELIDEAVAVARDADVAVMYIALPSYKESEGYDRPDLDLTEHQVALIKAVTAVQPRSVVVLNSGSAVAMSEWLDGPAAVLQAWMMGQAGGGAIADVLTGRVSPSGRLAETFPLRLADTPAYVNYPGENGEVHYGEGIFTGYRYYDKKETPVLFPFGYGLSYTTFEWSAPRLSATTFKDNDGVTVSVDVTNTGEMAGKEVVQVYVSQREPRLARPPKELKGFAKVELQPGETKSVAIPLDFRAFAYYDPAYGRWVTEDGEYDILIGASAADIRFTQTVTLQSTVQLPSLLNRESTVREWLRDPKGKEVFQPVFENMMGEVRRMFGSEALGAHSNAEMMSMLDMPLLSLLEFQEARMEVPAPQIVDGMLQQVHGQAR